jgi:hypothetical protein
MLDGGTATPTQSGANGSQNFWVDGAEIGPWTGLWHKTNPNLRVNILWLSLFHHNNHPNVGVRFDNVVVSTQRIGCN